VAKRGRRQKSVGVWRRVGEGDEQVTKRGRRQKSVGVWRRVGEGGGIAYQRRKWAKTGKRRRQNTTSVLENSRGIGQQKVNKEVRRKNSKEIANAENRRWQKCEVSAELSGLVIGSNTYVIKEGRRKRCKQSGEGKGQGQENKGRRKRSRGRGVRRASKEDSKTTVLLFASSYKRSLEYREE
jgi:hypothetical protein